MKYSRLNNASLTMSRPKSSCTYIKLLSLIEKNPGRKIPELLSLQNMIGKSWLYDYINYFINRNFAKVVDNHYIYITNQGINKIKEATN